MSQLYLDAAASTPMDSAVAAAMLAVMEGPAANPSSAHWAGRVAADLVRQAREQVGALVGANPSSVVFTSGATEANNLVLRGLGPLAVSSASARSTIVSARTEHPSVLATLNDLAACGVKVRLLDVDREGCIDLEQLRALVDETTLLVSLMAANSETGVLVNLAELGKSRTRRGRCFTPTPASYWRGDRYRPMWTSTWSRSALTRCTGRRASGHWSQAERPGSFLDQLQPVGDRRAVCAAAP